MKIISGKQNVSNYIDTTLLTHYKNQKLIPFIGAGFTKGERAKKGVVLDANETKERMIALINEYCKDFSTEDLKQYDFQKISNFFYKFVDKDAIIAFLRDHFTNVSIKQCKQNFLQLHWQFMYTLNIDDAIESITKLRHILPYKEIRDKTDLIDVVFKLHGDAVSEITYNEGVKVIFSREQYIKSLTENQTLLRSLKEDYLSRNFIFIGCSLDNEIDLEYILDKEDITNTATQVDRIYLTHQEPNFAKKSELEDIGINTIIVIESYDEFYEEINNKFSSVKFSDFTYLDSYKNPRLIIDNTYEFSKDYITSAKSIINKGYGITAPIFFSERDLLKVLLNSINNKNINILIGKRLAGKSFLAVSIANSIKNRDVYLFTSNISISETDINILFSLRNIVIIFDTNSISTTELNFISDNQILLKKNEISIVLILNSSDRLSVSIPNKLADCKVFELSNKFSNNETLQINDKLSSIGLIKDYRQQNYS